MFILGILFVGKFTNWCSYQTSLRFVIVCMSGRIPVVYISAVPLEQSFSGQKN